MGSRDVVIVVETNRSPLICRADDAVRDDYDRGAVGRGLRGRLDGNLAGACLCPVKSKGGNIMTDGQFNVERNRHFDHCIPAPASLPVA